MSNNTTEQKKLSDIPFSVLDLATILQGKKAADTYKNSIDLAQHVERWGFKRYWLAEHHSMESIASSATSILIGHIAGHTSTIRVGAGGIMLPNHAPLVIAEQFGTLESIYPGRIDLGLGRAPGSDQTTMRALRRNLVEGPNDFPESVVELKKYLSAENSTAKVRAIPGEGLHIPIWLLGSSTYSAQLAAILGMPFAFASHFAPTYLQAALQLYRDNFQPSTDLQTPYALACINVVAADSDEEANYIATSFYQLAMGIIHGSTKPLRPPVTNMDVIWSEPEKAAILQMMKYTFIGSPKTIKGKLEQFLSETQVDEIMVTSHIYDHSARIHSYEILSQIWKGKLT
ncbi:LLM class flavin-dependent oxidoreductase [Segetibacter aerophilus]|uniref:Luciferase-like monooxygenase n=1 Tax=Segetibacter aerophilus TaxID=670293 RepID=A0A512BJ57_9BACT|nr:LLM class flavin-dependent oxidoreductase [Segetibacter aerophilus]GEO11994.1 alkane 1-monooxygenase [Segetibacter aerophilus]